MGLTAAFWGKCGKLALLEGAHHAMFLATAYRPSIRSPARRRLPNFTMGDLLCLP